MKKILNLGSLNIDYVYEVENFVQPGQSISNKALYSFAGGKGLNQSIALSFAGAKVYHIGKIGVEGNFLIQILKKARVNTSMIEKSKDASGHAIIQINKNGENCIIIHGGTNKNISKNSINKALAKFAKGDFFLTQNETNLVPYAIEKAKQKGMKTVFNPAPVTSEVKNFPLNKVDIIILNETEAKELFGKIKDYKELHKIRQHYGFETILLTLGSKGAILCEENTFYHQKAHKVKVVDTTAAGDTFVGYFVAEKMNGKDSISAISTANTAASICVQTRGASNSIPLRPQVEKEFMNKIEK